MPPDDRVSASQNFTSLIIDLAQDIWRLQSTADRLARDGESSPTLIAAIIERLADDLTIAGIELIDPLGQPYDPNSTFEIAYVAPGEGQLFISETVTPGVKVSGKLVAKPRVILKPEGGQS